MLTFLPFILLILIVILTEIISRSRMNIGNQWLILVLSITLLWGIMIFLRGHLPAPVDISNWLPSDSGIGGIEFRLDVNSWVFAFALISLLMGSIATETIHLHERTNIRDWTILILLFSLGVAGTLLNSLLAIVLVWTLIDVIELLVQFIENNGSGLRNDSIGLFSLRLIGTFLIMAVLAMKGTSLESVSFSTGETALLIIGAGFRMVYTGKSGQERSSHPLDRQRRDLRKILPTFLTMVMLSKLSGVSQPSGILNWIMVIDVFAVLFSSIRWFVSSDPELADSAWMSAFSGLAIYSVLKGSADAAVAWGVLMIVLRGWLQIYTYRVKWMMVFAVLLLLSLTGLPFSISNQAYASLSGKPFFVLNFLLWPSLGLLGAGFLHSAIKPAEAVRKPENWMELFYTSGLILTMLTPWIPGLFPAAQTTNTKFIWLSGCIIFITSVIMVLTMNQKARSLVTGFLPVKTINALHLIGNAGNKAFELNWITSLTQILYRFLQRLVERINSILEGEGGVLWALVFLVLLLSLLVGNVSK